MSLEFLRSICCICNLCLSLHGLQAILWTVRAQRGVTWTISEDCNGIQRGNCMELPTTATHMYCITKCQLSACSDLLHDVAWLVPYCSFDIPALAKRFGYSFPCFSQKRDQYVPSFSFGTKLLSRSFGCGLYFSKGLTGIPCGESLHGMV